MRFAARVLAVAALAVLGVTGTAHATVITVNLGNVGTGWTSGTVQTSAGVLAAQSGQAAPFNALCGVESNTGSNCSKTWTFNYVVPVGETITAAELTLGLVDIDSKATGNQVGLYSIGPEVLTGTLNTLSEGLNGGTGAIQLEYDVFAISLSNLAALNAASSALVTLQLAGPGIGLLGTVNNNAASLIFSTLKLTTEAINGNPGGGDPNPTPVPEPTSMMLLATGMGILARARARKAL